MRWIIELEKKIEIRLKELLERIGKEFIIGEIFIDKINLRGDIEWLIGKERRLGMEVDKDEKRDEDSRIEKKNMRWKIWRMLIKGNELKERKKIDWRIVEGKEIECKIIGVKKKERRNRKWRKVNLRKKRENKGKKIKKKVDVGRRILVIEGKLRKLRKWKKGVEIIELDRSERKKILSNERNERMKEIVEMIKKIGGCWMWIWIGWIIIKNEDGFKKIKIKIEEMVK